METVLGTGKEISTPLILRAEGREIEQHPLEVGRQVTLPKARRSRIYLGKVIATNIELQSVLWTNLGGRVQ